MKKLPTKLGKDPYAHSSSSILENSYTAVPTSDEVNFEQAMSNFYTQLLSQQRPLGEEFEKILYDNLWDLYVS